MNDALKNSIMNQLHTTAKALERNRFEAHVVADQAELLAELKKLLPKGAVICSGGSMTLQEAGVNGLLSGGDYDFYDRGRVDAVTGQPVNDYLKAFAADWYFVSSNAITLTGELYNVDGIGNRVAAIAYGPKNVVVIAGYNKIVKDLAAADERVRAIAAPANCVRLSKTNGCHLTGHCVDCHSDNRICCTSTISRYQREAGRVKVFLLPEILGY